MIRRTQASASPAASGLRAGILSSAESAAISLTRRDLPPYVYQASLPSGCGQAPLLTMIFSGVLCQFPTLCRVTQDLICIPPFSRGEFS